MSSYKETNNKMRLSNNFKGAIFISLSMGAYISNDSFMKLSASEASLTQAVFLRGLIASLIIFFIATSQKKINITIPLNTYKFLILRVIGEIGSTFCFLYAIFNMPLANATAILQSIPLAITLAAIIFLQEPVGWRRGTAILFGFLGVLIIIRPGAEGFNEYSIFALFAVGFIVLRDLITKNIALEVPSIFVTLISTVSITSVSGISIVFFEWSDISNETLLLIIGAACFLTLGSLLNVIAMRLSEVSFTAPFRYTLLLWAILFGVIIFNEIPDLYSIAGGCIITISGIYMFHREFNKQN